MSTPYAKIFVPAWRFLYHFAEPSRLTVIINHPQSRHKQSILPKRMRIVGLCTWIVGYQTRQEIYSRNIFCRTMPQKNIHKKA
jgi:hypothetical protein